MQPFCFRSSAVLFFASAAMRLCVFSCGARRLDGLWPGKAPIAPQRREGGPDASAAEPVGAALALAVV